MRSRSQPWLLALFALLTVAPLAAGILYALAYSLGLTGLLNTGFTLAHWRAVLGAGVFWQALWFSAAQAVGAISLALALALVVVLWRPGAFRTGLLSFAIYLPLTMPAIVVAFLAFQGLSKSGLLSRMAYALGFIGGLEQFPDMINDPAGIGILLAHAGMATPFFILLLTQLYEQERVAAYTSLAATLGATRRQRILKVQTPLLLRRAFPTVVLYALFVMSAYEIPLLLGSQSRPMVTVLAVEKLQRYNLADIPQAYTISVLYSVVVIGATLWLLGRQKTQ